MPLCIENLGIESIVRTRDEGRGTKGYGHRTLDEVRRDRDEGLLYLVKWVGDLRNESPRCFETWTWNESPQHGKIFTILDINYEVFYFLSCFFVWVFF